MKKTLSLIMTAVMLLTVIFSMSVNSFAAGNSLVVTTDKKTYNPGETARVTVKLNASNLSGIDFSLIYDTDTYTCSTSTASVSDSLGNYSVGFPTGQVHVVSVKGNGTNYTDTVAFTVNFVVGNKGKDFDIGLKLNDALDGSDNDIVSSFNVVSKTLYPDTSYSEWYYPAVKFTTLNGYFQGYQNGTFGPANNIERQDFVVVLARMAGVDLTDYSDKNGNFSDVPVGSYYAPAIAWAVDNHIITGYGGTSRFGVGDPITREQVCAIFYRYIGSYLGDDVSLVKTEMTILSKYEDRNSISDWARTNVAWAVENGVIKGTTSTTVTPGGNANRAQLSQIIMNMTENGLLK